MGLRTALKLALKKLLYRGVYPAVYHACRLRPVDEGRVLFFDGEREDEAPNLRLVREYCARRGYRCRTFLIRKHISSGSRIVRAVQRQAANLEAYVLLLQSRAVFLTNMFYPLCGLRSRKETTIVQLWHACGAMKKFGYSIEGGDWSTMSMEERAIFPVKSPFSLVCVSCRKAVKPFEEALGASPGQVQAIGVPRTDLYYDNAFVAGAADRVRDMFPQINGRKIILYAPTFRGAATESYMEMSLDLAGLARELSGEYVLLVRPHPRLAGRMSFTATAQTAERKSAQTAERKSAQTAERKSAQTAAEEMSEQTADERTSPQSVAAETQPPVSDFAFDASKLTAEEALCAADVLVTDYSSIAFEYLLLERPIISYVWDRENYEKRQGLYYPYEELLPGPYAGTQGELTDLLKTVPTWFDRERTHRYREEYMSACDGHSTERIFNRVFGK